MEQAPEVGLPPALVSGAVAQMARLAEGKWQSRYNAVLPGRIRHQPDASPQSNRGFAGWLGSAALLPAARTKPSVARALPWPFQPEEEQGAPVVPQRSPPQSPAMMARVQHLDGDQQHVQSSGLLRGGHGLAAGLQLADGNPADALEGLVGLHLLQGDDEDVALFVFDGLKEDLPQVLDAQQSLRERTGGREKAAGQGTSSRHSTLWIWAAGTWLGGLPPASWKPACPAKHPLPAPSPLHGIATKPDTPLPHNCGPAGKDWQSRGFSWAWHSHVLLPREPGSPKSTHSPPMPTLTCICEMASSILKRVCRMQEQDDWETVTHCRSHRISSHMHDTCSTPKGHHHRPPLPSACSHKGVLGKSICLSI